MRRNRVRRPLSRRHRPPRRRRKQRKVSRPLPRRPPPRNVAFGKTRAQVRRELEQAERVGEIKRIDRFFGRGS
ncbi:DUF4148 domain-containing protein [Burkholderia cepacia]|uniref:DUF4148 domain-containing protein n=1 Tax=Burkholderia cepacia TaxID=292 RepID=UPI0038B832B1